MPGRSGLLPVSSFEAIFAIHLFINYYCSPGQTGVCTLTFSYTCACTYTHILKPVGKAACSWAGKDEMMKRMGNLCQAGGRAMGGRRQRLPQKYPCLQGISVPLLSLTLRGGLMCDSDWTIFPC